MPGDWNAFFGFGTNILVNLLTLTGLLRFVLKMPDDIVFGRILAGDRPHAVPLHALLRVAGLRLAKKTGRTDVCALPSGISVPHMFIVTFVIMLPIAAQDRRSDQGLGGGPDVGVHPELRPDDRRLRRTRHPEDHAARGAARHARRCLGHLHLDGSGLQMFMTPVIGVTCFAIILVSWFGGIRYARCSRGLVAIAAGTLIAWGSTAVRSQLRRHDARVSPTRLPNFGFPCRFRLLATCSRASSSSGSFS